MQLSPHFTLEEFVFSQTAKRFHLDNTPSPEVVENLKKTAAALEVVRHLLGDLPISVNSGYRSKEVNRKLGGSTTSHHCLGYAVDFRCPRFGSPIQIVYKLKEYSGFRFDQLILEYDDWVHLSVHPKMREQILYYNGHAYSTTLPKLK